jgi:hypothetical protein
MIIMKMTCLISIAVVLVFGSSLGQGIRIGVEDVPSCRNYTISPRMRLDACWNREFKLVSPAASLRFDYDYALMVYDFLNRCYFMRADHYYDCGEIQADEGGRPCAFIAKEGQNNTIELCYDQNLNTLEGRFLNLFTITNDEIGKMVADLEPYVYAYKIDLYNIKEMKG